MRDGHIHSPYCPHGTTDSLKLYIERAVELGYRSMTFTEHAPLPPSFSDPVPEKDSSMALKQMEKYLKDIQELKEQYQDDLFIHKGLEVDYIEGYELEIENFLNTYGPELDDSILSVHFLQGKQGWYCIDYSPEMFEAAVNDLGSLEHLYETYYKSMESSVRNYLGPYKPKRVGHMTLVKKFQHLFPSPVSWKEKALQFLEVVKDYDMELDYNGAGMKKPHCKETYPPHDIAKRAYSMGILLIYGSDAHQSSALLQGFTSIDEELIKP